MLVLASAAVLWGCSQPDPDQAVKDRVFACITDGGGTIEESTDLAVVDGRAMATIGPVDASNDLVIECLAATD